MEEGYTSMQRSDITLRKKEKRGDRERKLLSPLERIERINKPTRYLFIFSISPVYVYILLASSLLMANREDLLSMKMHNLAKIWSREAILSLLQQSFPLEGYFWIGVHLKTGIFIFIKALRHILIVANMIKRGHFTTCWCSKCWWY